MRIEEMHDRGRPVFSFEFFPPKTDEGAENLMVAAAELRDVVAPDFVSVTYGAGARPASAPSSACPASRTISGSSPWPTSPAWGTPRRRSAR